MKEKLKKMFIISPLKIALLIIIIALISFRVDFSFLRFMELKALDLRMVSRGTLPPGNETAIVTIDEKSLSELGHWPWPRTTNAALINALNDYGVKAVGFDIFFPEPERTANSDAIFAKSIRKGKNVTLGYFFDISGSEVAHLTEKDIKTAAKNISSSRYQLIESQTTPDESVLQHAYAPVTNIKLISDAAENSGYVNAFPDIDGTNRWSPLIVKFRDNYYPSLAMSLLYQYLGRPACVVKISDIGVEGITLGRTEIPTDVGGRLLINYRGRAKTFPHYSASDVIKHRLAPDLLRNKIVIWGATATGLYDMRVTPFSPAYPGVEIHATVVDNILHKHFLEQSSWTSFLDVCSIIIFGLLMGIVIPRVKAIYGIIFSLFIISAFIAANTYIFSHYNVWLNLIYPVLTMLTIYLGITVYRYVTEEREKKKIRGAFQYYLTASVINEMLKDPSKLKLGGDKKELSVLFSDIRGFTSISEKLSPEELVRLLNEYLTAMTDIVFKYDGLLDKYMGDAIMAVFGAPLDQPDHALRACKTALDMLVELRKLQKKWADEGKPVLNIGVGVNTGDMVVGNMGSQMRFDYTVMGDSVNLGSRLEGINKEYGTNIVISEFTHNVVKGALFCRELDSVRVKGKVLPVRIYELICEQKDAAQWQEFVKLFEEGLTKYKDAKWTDAIEIFRKVLTVKPGDPPSELYIERCQELEKNPPESPWDGVFTMTKK